MNREPTFPARELSTQQMSLAEIGELLCLSFPKKLWKLVESDNFKSIRWSENGDCVIIEEEFFQREILDRKGLIRIFETSNLKSFIRQLNLYGFSKIRMNRSSIRFHQGTKKIMIYRNSNFRRDLPFLIQRIKRRVGIRHSAPSSSFSSLPKRKRGQVPKTHVYFRESGVAHYSRRVIVQKGRKKMLKKFQKTQKKRSHNYHAPPTWSFDNSASHSRQNLPQFRPREVQSNISEEASLFYPDFMSICAQITTLMSLYNLWFAMLMAAVSSVPQSESSGQQAPSSGQRCPVCNCYRASHQPNQ